MNTLKNTGKFELSANIMGQFQGLFGADKCDNSQTLSTIKALYEQTGQVIDPHTAIGVYVGEKCHQSNVPLINLACAAAAKFPEIVKQATGYDAVLPHFLADLHTRPERLQEIDNDIEAFKAIIGYSKLS
jgi:threonine synthase